MKRSPPAPLPRRGEGRRNSISAAAAYSHWFHRRGAGGDHLHTEDAPKRPSATFAPFHPRALGGMLKTRTIPAARLIRPGKRHTPPTFQETIMNLTRRDFVEQALMAAT